MKRLILIAFAILVVVLYPQIYRFWYNRRPPFVSLEQAAATIGPVKQWMKERVSTELGSMPTKLDLEAIMSLNYPLVRVTVEEGSVRYSPDLTGNVRFDAIKAGLDRLVKLTRIEPCEFALCLGDTIEWNSAETAPPIFVFSRRESDRGLILFPDFSCFADRCAQYAWITHVAPEVRQASARSPWNKKFEVAMWRGAATGFGNWPFQAPRCRLTQLSKRFPDIVDAGFTHFDQVAPTLRKQLVTKNFLTPSDQLGYKYLICIDGNTTTYPGLHWRLLSNSLVLKCQSDHIQWYYGALKEGTHYISIAPDCSNLVEKIKWLKKNDDVAEDIALTATEFAEENLSLPAIFAYTAHLLNTYASYCKNPPRGADDGNNP